MKARIVIAGAAAVALLGTAVLARAWFAPEPATQTFAGTYAAGTELGVRNLTIQGGHVRVGYSLDVLFDHPVPGTTLRCGLVDTSGTLDFFEGSRTNAPEGRWVRLSFEADYELPELTLGIRCSPSADGVMSAVFRGVTLSSSVAD